VFGIGSSQIVLLLAVLLAVTAIPFDREVWPGDPFFPGPVSPAALIECQS
jgi:hypothetical protein